MVAIGAFPVAKLGALVLKQISKPLANAIKQQAKNSPVFSRYVCMPPARFYNWCEVKAKMWVLQLGKPVNITVLNDAMAIELGANLLGEAIIFLVAAGVLVFEYNRSSKKEAAKEEAKRQEIQDLQHTISELYMQTEEQAARIRELSRMFCDLEGRVVQKPWVPKKETEQPKERDPPTPSAPTISRRSLDSVNQPSTTPTLDINYKVAVQNLPKGLLRTVNEIELQFWQNPNAKRKEGMLTSALNHLYSEVYRNPIKF